MYIMNLLDNRTIAQMAKAYAEKQKSKVAKSPNMAVSGVTGKGDYPVKPAVPDRARSFKPSADYYSAENVAKRNRARAEEVARDERNSRVRVGWEN